VRRTDIDDALLDLLDETLFVTAQSASDTLGYPLGATRRSLQRLVRTEHLVGMQVANTAALYCRVEHVEEARDRLCFAVEKHGVSHAAAALVTMAGAIAKAGGVL
jgi:arginase family enzyme